MKRTDCRWKVNVDTTVWKKTPATRRKKTHPHIDLESEIKKSCSLNMKRPRSVLLMQFRFSCKILAVNGWSRFPIQGESLTHTHRRTRGIGPENESIKIKRISLAR